MPHSPNITVRIVGPDGYREQVLAFDDAFMQSNRKFVDDENVIYVLAMYEAGVEKTIVTQKSVWEDVKRRYDEIEAEAAGIDLLEPLRRLANDSGGDKPPR